MALIDTTAIIADDLTGANDTALQFFKKGCSARILIDIHQDFSDVEKVDVMAVTTESRNIDKNLASNVVADVSNKFLHELGVENFYKKIDSTLRGNVGIEVLSMLEILKKDVVIIAPAYIEEGRSTVGGYQLLNGIPIERTQCALDPKAPIYDSFIPDILENNVEFELVNLVAILDFRTILKGAGPIVLKLNELIQSGKKIIVLDACSTTDLEQIALAINKCNYDILPCGSAGLADAISKTINEERETNKKIDVFLPRLIVSGSATQLSSNQIQKLKEEKRNIHFIDLKVQNIIDGFDEEFVDEIVQKLKTNIDVVIHSSDINRELLEEEAHNQLIDAGIEKLELSSKITNYLADLTSEVKRKSDFILVMVGGETSYKCAHRINSSYLDIVDAIMPAIPLCVDKNGTIITTKSGNFGTSSTLVEIINYFDRLKNEKL